MSTKIVSKRINYHCNTWEHSYHAIDNPMRSAIIALRGGEPLFSYQVEYVDERGILAYQIHTILNTGIVFVGDIRSKRVVTRYPFLEYYSLDIYHIDSDMMYDQVDINARLLTKLSEIQGLLERGEM